MILEGLEKKRTCLEKKTFSCGFFFGSGLRSNGVITAWVFSGVSGFFSVPSHG